MTPLHEQLQGLDVHIAQVMGGAAINLQPIPGEVPVVQVSIDGRDELPIFITRSDSQVLCLNDLWSVRGGDADRQGAAMARIRARHAARSAASAE